MRIAFFSAKKYDREFFDLYTKRYNHQPTYFEASLNDQTVGLAQGFKGICVFVNDTIDKKVIEQLADRGTNIIGLRCSGFNNVDLKTAAEKNIKVVRVPAYSPHAVAEHAVALILTLNRKTHKAYNRIRENNFSLEKLLGFNLFEKKVGVIGTGEIGKAFCEIMLGFGCSVIAYDVVESAYLKEKGVRYLSIDDLFRSSDIISLHCPLNNATRHIINQETLAKMKDGVMIINTGRGALIDTADVIDALKSGKIGYLGIDVYEQEADLFFKDLSESIISDELFSRLMTFPNVLLTAHQGFFTKEALAKIATTTLQNFTDFENHEVLKNEVKL